MLHQLIRLPFYAVEEGEKAGYTLYLCFEMLQPLGFYLWDFTGGCLKVGFSSWAVRLATSKAAWRACCLLVTP